MTPERERWAEALAVEDVHGPAASAFVIDRIGTLAVAGDVAGVERWRAIASRLDALREGKRQ